MLRVSVQLGTACFVYPLRFSVVNNGGFEKQKPGATAGLLL
jgi:hypothetical protein